MVRPAIDADDRFRMRKHATTDSPCVTTLGNDPITPNLSRTEYLRISPIE